METHRGRETGQLDAGRLDAELPESQAAGDAAAVRRRAAIELLAKHSASLKQTARRYSLCKEDAEDAHQRSLEILLTKAPTDQPHELIRWTHTVVKHEALAIRRHRERLLGGVPVSDEGKSDDWMALIPASGDGPEARAERREHIARSREALKTLKPAELRALTLLAEGYSYAEIGRITQFSLTKVNRCIAEGRERFRTMLARSEDGTLCRELRPVLSAFCDGEASAEDAAVMREHLRACASCRAAMRAYRATPGAAAALAPALPLSRSLLERAHDTVSELISKLPGGGGAAGSTAQVAAAGGTKTASATALAKILAACAATAGGAATCAAIGVVPPPLDLTPSHTEPPAIKRSAPRQVEAPAEERPAPEPEPSPPVATPQAEEPPPPPEEEAPVAPPPPAEAGGVEYAPPPPEPPPPSSTSSGSPAGEFGP